MRHITYDIDGSVVSEENLPDVAFGPPSNADRIAAMEAQLEAVKALAAKADATAQEVAQAVKNAAPVPPR